MATSGSLTAWLRDLVGAADYGRLVADAADVPAGSRGLVVLPYFAGERSPLFDPDARGIIAGLTLSHTRDDLFRAVYEAIGYGVRHILETFAAVGAAPERIVAVGGGTQGRLWTQVVSDVRRLQQTVPEQTIGAAYGDALLAAIGSGLVAPETDWTQTRDEVLPNEARASTYDDLYDLYRRLHPATAEIQHALSRLARAQAG
jgi:xylulokinase